MGRWPTAPGAGVLLALLVLVTGCGGGGGSTTSGGDDMDIAQLRTLVDGQAADVAEAIRGSDAALQRAEGRYSVCGTEPSPTISYAATLVASGGAQAVTSAGDALEQAGWTVEQTSDSGVDLARDDVTVSVRVFPGQTDRITLGVSGGCVEGRRSDIDGALGPEPLDLS